MTSLSSDKMLDKSADITDIPQDIICETYNQKGNGNGTKDVDIWYTRPPRCFEVPHLRKELYFKLAADEIVSEMPKGTSTFSSVEVCERVAKNAPHVFTPESIEEIPLDNIKSWVSGVVVGGNNDFYVVSMDDSEIVFGVKTNSQHYSATPEDSKKAFSVRKRTTVRSIPWQLEDAKLIALLPKDKLPVGARRDSNKNKIGYRHRKGSRGVQLSWENEDYQYTRREMIDVLVGVHTNKKYGYNYGVINKMYVIIDCDNYDAIRKIVPAIDNLISSTFTVKSGRDTSTGFHIYMLCDDAPNGVGNLGQKLAFANAENSRESMGDIRIHGDFFTVGVGSFHPKTGNPYSVYTDLPIRKFAWSEIEPIIQPLLVNKDAKKRDEKVHESNKRLRDVSANINENNDCSNGDKFYPESILDSSKISVLTVLMPDNAEYLGDGEYAGAHPIHGSTTGSNLHVNKYEWYCFRHDCGGHLRSAIAISLGLRDCGDTDRPFTQIENEEIDCFIDAADPENYQAYKAARIDIWKKRKDAEKQSRIDAIIRRMAGGQQQ